MEDDQLQEQVLEITEQMHILRKQLNANEINGYQFRILKEHLDNQLYALTGSTDLMW
jgi:hypothetical protein